MKLLPLLLCSLLVAACQSQPDHPTEPFVAPNSSGPASPVADALGSPRAAAGWAKLALTSNALQLVQPETGSTKEIALGQPYESLVRTVTDVLAQAPASVGVNGECGAGPLKMAT